MWDRLIKRHSKTAEGGLILMYHRVSKLRNDPWSLAVSPANFREQIIELKAHYTLVALSQFQQAMSEGVKNPIALTFDDGYADNYYAAAPVLSENNVPASFFICTGMIGSGHSFWWDALQQILLDQPVLPSQLQLPIADKTTAIDLTGEESLNIAQAERYALWRYPQNPPGKRGRAYMDIWQMMKKIDHGEQVAVIKRLQEWSGRHGGSTDDYRVMTEKELQELASHPLFTIGAHTVHHPPLSQCGADVQKQEILSSKIYLEKLSGTKIASFAYPFGDYNSQTSSILKCENFTTAVTTNNYLINKDSDPLQFGRYLVRDVSGKQLLKEIHNQLIQH